MEVLNAVAKPATKPAPAKAIISEVSGSSSLPFRANFPKSMVIQATNIAAKAEDKLDIRFTAKATFSGLSERISATHANILPTNKNTGAPGG